MTNREKDSVRLLPKCNEADSEAEAGSDSGSEDDMAYATNILKLHHQQKSRRVSKYSSRALFASFSAFSVELDYYAPPSSVYAVYSLGF